MLTLKFIFCLVPDFVPYPEKFGGCGFRSYFLEEAINDELDHISVWAATNNLKLNATKSRELILHRRRGLVPPASIPDVERVSTMKVLGVTLRDDLNASTHITGVLGA